MTRRVCVVLFCLLLVAVTTSAQEAHTRALAAFRDVTAVLASPRCVNCHIAGDSPLQGDDGQPHVMRIKRGADGRGTPAVRCQACHQSQNIAADHAPPGAEGWRLPPPNARMAWQGLSPSALCRNLNDPRKTGGRTLAQLVRHVSGDHLVQWGFQPGPGRTVPPLSHEAFVAAFQTWADAGGPCPADGGAR
jgi:hypothetical protein